MKKIIYPGVFHKEDGSYWVEFPDLEGCQSFGDTLEDVYENAKEALSAYCVTLLEQNRTLNPPSDISAIQQQSGQTDGFVSLVDVDLLKRSPSVKKTLTIPSWLNEVAESNHINFSGVLQEAIMQKLNIAQS